MKNLLIFFLLMTTSSVLKSQSMDNDKLNSIFYTVSDTIQGQDGQWQFVIDSVMFYCLTDKLHNRMRIIAPIMPEGDVSQDELKKCMEANFHTALDIRYALSDGVVWSAFIHPLKELTKEQVISALSQVYSGVKTFGTHYSSGELSFPTNEERKSSQN